MSGKREKYIDWDSYFMSIAFVSSLRSKDPNTRHGACIINCKKHIVGTGYNGFPNGCEDDIFPWGRTGELVNTKIPYVVHAELNAIINSTSKDLYNCKLYLYSQKGYYPCSECSKAIIQSGIKEIIMPFAMNKDTDIYTWEPTKKMFESANVNIRLMGFEDFQNGFEFISKEFTNDLNRIKNEYKQ
jgi:dCMP deaminase